MNYIYKVLSAGAQQISIESGSRPLANQTRKLSENVEAICEERGAKVKDFDSYKRRLKNLREKREDAQAKTGQPASEDLQNEIKKFETKCSSAEATYNQLNNDAKAAMLEGKRAGDRMLESLLLSVVFAQAEFMRKGALHLERVLALFPVEQVIDIYISVSIYKSIYLFFYLYVSYPILSYLGI